MDEETVLVLRTCKADMTSTNNFRWPDSGPVECPDWKPTAECGHGLHGWLWGEGDGPLGNWSSNAKWLVVRVAKADMIDLKGKVKFPRGVVEFCGERLAATQYLAAHGAAGRAIVGHTATAGNSGTATAGDSGTATAGYYGTATAGDFGTATAGYSGTATAGYSGTATAGNSGTATAGRNGVLAIAWWDDAAQRRRVAIGYVGENGIEPATRYRLDAKGNFIKATEE